MFKKKENVGNIKKTKNKRGKKKKNSVGSWKHFLIFFSVDQAGVFNGYLVKPPAVGIVWVDREILFEGASCYFAERF